jgi:hypothetical protein
MRKQARFEILLCDKYGDPDDGTTSITIAYYAGQNKPYYDKAEGALIDDDGPETDIVYSSKELNWQDKARVIDEFWIRYYANEL